MLSDLLQNLTGIWCEALYEAGIRLQPPLSVIQIGGAKGKDRKVNYLVFAAERPSPVLMMKVARTAGYQERLQHEYAAMTAVWQTPALQNSVPRPLGLFTLGDNFVLLEECLPGTPLKVLLRRQQHTSPNQVQQDSQQALAWLQTMQQVTHAGIEAFAGETAVTTRLAKLDHALPDKFCTTLLALAREFTGLSIPLSSRHGDYWPGNLMLHQGKLGIIDWEDFSAVAWPFHDLFLFFTNYTHTYPWQGWRWTKATSAFDRAFFQDNWFSQLIATSTQAYFSAFNLPSAAAHLFFSLFLLERAAPAVHEGQKRQEQSGVWQERLHHYAHHQAHSIFQGGYA